MAYFDALFVGFLALSAQAAGDQQVADAALCHGEAMSIYLPDSETAPAPNISLAQFQYRSEGDPCGRNVSHDELMRLYQASKSLTAASFSKSEKTFVLFVKYALATDGPATLEMRASIPQTGDEELGSYYDKAATLADYHSSKDTVEVFFRYEISPSPLKGKAPSDGGG
jgi:hypothetical protein